MKKRFVDLTEQELLALAISLEEEHTRTFDDFSEGLRVEFPASAKLFKHMSDEENEHRRRLLHLYREKFGDHVPLIRTDDIRGFVKRTPGWLIRTKGIEAIRKHVEVVEYETKLFYERALTRVTDPAVRELIGDLAREEGAHQQRAIELEESLVPKTVKEEEDAVERRLFLLRIVQPGLAGLMDGSVSTLAPLFAAAFATHSSHDAFLVGMAASVGAGISMGFTEAVSDDGSLTGRGQPLLRGVICGLMTCVGGIGHTLPYLVSDFKVATALAVAVVVCELIAIAWIRKRYMDTPWLSALTQVVLGGTLVFLAGILIGHG